MSITLALPRDYDVPTIMRSTTPQENAMMLSMAPIIIQTLRSVNYDEVRSQLKKADSQNAELINAIRGIERGVIEAIEERLSTISDDVAAAIGDINIEPDRETKKELKAHGTELKAHGTELKAHGTELKEIKTLLGRESSIVAAEKMMAKLDAAVAEIEKTKHKPVIKGAMTEQMLERLIIETFGTPGSGFVMRSSVLQPGDKHIRSGDHIIEWNGCVIMFEDKDYQKEVGKSQVEKAVRDFDLHPECNVLVMISMNTPIRGHETAENIKAVVYGNRLVLYVSNFAHNVDMYGYMRRVIQPIIMASKPVLNRIEQGDDMVREYIEEMIPALLFNIETQERQLEQMMKDMRAHMGLLQNSIRIQHTTVKNIVEKLTARGEVVDGTAKPAQSKPRAARKCGLCGMEGHNARTCSN